MSELEYTYALVEGNTGLGTKIMQNLTDARAVLNALDETNFAVLANVHAASMEATEAAVVARVDPAVAAEESFVDLPTVVTAMLEITDADDNVLFQIDASGHTKVGA